MTGQWTALPFDSGLPYGTALYGDGALPLLQEHAVMPVSLADAVWEVTTCPFLWLVNLDTKDGAVACALAASKAEGLA